MSILPIESMIDSYFREELMIRENQFFCDGCKSKTNAKKTLQISKSPNILILHLNRFYFKKGKTAKIHQPVRFPVSNLCLNGTGKHSSVASDNKYELFGVIFHSGDCSSGHYTAATKETFLNQWILYDDEKCYKLSQVDFQNRDLRQKAYLLFYIKNDLKAFRRQTLSNFENKILFMRHNQSDII